jgi:hypothetical protein
MALNFSILPERSQRIGLLGAGVPDVASPRRSILQFPTTAILKHIDNTSLYLQDQLPPLKRSAGFASTSSASTSTGTRTVPSAT